MDDAKGVADIAEILEQQDEAGKENIIRLKSILKQRAEKEIIRKLDAMANLKKAAENGPTSFATTLPAMKVPPQKIAVNNNLT